MSRRYNSDSRLRCDAECYRITRPQTRKTDFLGVSWRDPAMQKALDVMWLLQGERCGITNGLPVILHQPFIKDDWESLHSMLDSLPSPFLLDSEGKNLLHYAVAFNAFSIASNLLRLYPTELWDSVSHRRRGCYSSTPLHQAIAYGGDDRMVKLLLESRFTSVFAVRNGSPGSLCTKDSALHAALRRGSRRTDGGRPRLEDLQMFDLVLATASKFEGCRGLDLINVVGNGSCQTLMQFAVSERNYEAVEQLVLRGARFRQRWIRALKRDERRRVMAAVKRSFMKVKGAMDLADECLSQSLSQDVVDYVLTFATIRNFSELKKMFPDVP